MADSYFPSGTHEVGYDARVGGFFAGRHRGLRGWPSAKRTAFDLSSSSTDVHRSPRGSRGIVPASHLTASTPTIPKPPTASGECPASPWRPRAGTSAGLPRNCLIPIVRAAALVAELAV